MVVKYLFRSFGPAVRSFNGYLYALTRGRAPAAAPSMVRRLAAVALLAAVPAYAFPLLGQVEESAAAKEKSGPCRERRPLPAIDPAVGLSWLQHVEGTAKALGENNCLKRVSLGWEELSAKDAPRLAQLMKAGVEVLFLFQNQVRASSHRQRYIAAYSARWHPRPQLVNVITPSPLAL